MARADSPLAERMVFVVGARRSGTNLVQRMLSAHPRVLAVPSETHLFSHGLKPLIDHIQTVAPRAASPGLTFMEPDELVDGLRDFCDRVFDGLARALGGPGDCVIVERTPWHAYALDLITEVYPDATVVHIVRDGRDCARSLLSQDWGPSSMEEAAEEWRSSVEAARTSGPRARTYLEVRYEELIVAPEVEVARLYEGLGLPVSDGELTAALETAGVRFNVDSSAPEIGSGKWRTRLSDDDLMAFHEVAGELLGDLGYPSDLEVRSPVVAAPHRRTGLRSSLQRRKVSRQGRRARAVLQQLQASQQVLEAFASDVGDQRWDAVIAPLDDRVVVRVEGAEHWSAEGTAATVRFASLLKAHSALWSRRARWEIFAGVPHSTLVCWPAIGGGSSQHATFVLTIQGRTVTEVVFIPRGGD